MDGWVGETGGNNLQVQVPAWKHQRQAHDEGAKRSRVTRRVAARRKVILVQVHGELVQLSVDVKSVWHDTLANGFQHRLPLRRLGNVGHGELRRRHRQRASHRKGVHRRVARPKAGRYADLGQCPQARSRVGQ